MQIVLKNTPEEVQQAYATAYEKAAKKVRVPGFRPGKVPMEVLERELGDAVAGDAAQILVASSMEKLLGEIKPPPISVPSFEVEQFDRKQGATYRGTFDTYPEVKLGKYKKIKASQDTVEVLEEDIMAEIEKLRKDHSIMHTRDDGALAGDVLTIELDIRESGGKKKLYHNKDYKMVLSEPSPFPGLVEQLLGAKSGESKSYDQQMEESFPDPKFAGKLVSVTANISTVQYPVLPELNDDLAKEVSEFDTLGALKKNIRETLTKQADNILKDRCMKTILDLIAKDSKTEMPQTLVDAEIEERVKQIARSIGRKDLTLEQLAEMMGKPAPELRKELNEASVGSVKKRLVLEEIAKKEEVKVEEADILEYAEERFGTLTDDLKKTLLSNEKFLDEIEGAVLFRKTFDWIHRNADIKLGEKVKLSTLMQATGTGA